VNGRVVLDNDQPPSARKKAAAEGGDRGLDVVTFLVVVSPGLGRDR